MNSDRLALGRPEPLRHVSPERVIAFLARNEPESEMVFYEQLYKDIRIIIQDLEDVRHDLHHFFEEKAKKPVHEREESLRGRILSGLKARDYSAAAEPDISGHVDILVVVPIFNRRWLAECKVHTQYDKHEKGMLQLHARYSSGRCQASAFIIFCFNADAFSVMSGWRSLISSKKLCELQSEPSPIVDQEFTSIHRSKVSGLDVETRHFIAGLYYSPEDKE